MNESYPRTESDKKLNELGYDLLDENREAVRLAGFKQCEPVLDIATGSGRMLLALVEAGYHVVSGDISEDVVRGTRERLGGLVHGEAEFRVLDATHMDFENDGIESVVTANAMHHMEDPRRVLEEMARVLKPNGKLLLVEFNARGFDVIGQIHHEVHGGIHERGHISAREIDDFLRAQFKTVERHDLKLNSVWIASHKHRRHT